MFCKKLPKGALPVFFFKKINGLNGFQFILLIYSGPPRDGHRFASVELNFRSFGPGSYGSVKGSGSPDLDSHQRVTWNAPVSTFKIGPSEYSDEEKNSIKLTLK
jgi:hypothetical protein